MSCQRWGEFKSRLIRWFLLLAPGAIAPSCATDVRDAAISGGLDYVSGSVTLLLEGIVPLPEFE